jgi:hypothetical protein
MGSTGSRDAEKGCKAVMLKEVHVLTSSSWLKKCRNPPPDKMIKGS